MTLLYYCFSHGTMPLPVISEKSRFLCPHCRNPLAIADPDLLVSLPRVTDAMLRAANLPAHEAGLLSNSVACPPAATDRGLEADRIQPRPRQIQDAAP